jgi:hypothetical protein
LLADCSPIAHNGARHITAKLHRINMRLHNYLASLSRASLRTILPVFVMMGLLLTALPVRAQEDGPAEPPIRNQTDDGSDENEVPLQRTPVSAGTYYGLNFVQPFDPWLSIAHDSGAGTVRWQFNWRDAEISPGVWDWRASDDPIRAWNEAGIQIHAILHNPPDWAKANAGGLVPTNYTLPWDDPANGWGQFCYRFAQRYKGQIASYEIWNEPDLNQYWESSASEYYQLMKTCYKAIKAADPSATIAMAGMVLVIERDFFPTVVRLAAEDPEGPANNYFFDVAAIHMYADPNLVYSLTVYTRRILNAYGQGYKPIWITETNIALAGHGGFMTADWGHVSEEEQSWYVLQASANAFAAGADRLMFFRLADDGMNESFGLVHQNGNPRPSYKALQIATSLMHDVVEARREIRQNVVITHLVRSDGARIVVLFSEAGSALNVDIEARQAAAVLIDSGGSASAIEAHDGLYTVSVLPAINRDFTRVHALGGPVVIVLEQDTEAPVVVADAVPVDGEPGKILVRWAGDDGLLGTGIASFEIQVSIDDGPWQTWQAGVVQSEGLYDISGGGSFAFRVRAIDKAGNLGEFSNVIATSLIAQGTLLMQITDLRGQQVPFARVTLSDGTLHDADANGLVTITSRPGLVRIASIDGSAQGNLRPGQPFEIELSESTQTSWMLQPLQNLIRNSQFEFGAQGWLWSSPADVSTEHDPSGEGSLLQLHGSRRAWGLPAATTEVDIPQGWNAAVLSFHVRIPYAGSILRVRAITNTGQRTLWQSTDSLPDFQRIWVDLSAYEGQHVMLSFELISDKGDPPTTAEIDNVILGNVPPLP